MHDIRHHVPEEDAEDCRLALAARTNALRQHDGPAVVEVEQLEPMCLQLDQHLDEVAAEQGVRVGGQHPRADHLGDERGRCGRRWLPEPLQLLLLQSGEHLLVIELLLQVLLLQLGVEFLQLRHFSLHGLGLPRLREVAVASLHVLPLRVHLLLRRLHGLARALIALGGGEDVLQRQSPERHVEVHGEALILEVLRQDQPDASLQLCDGRRLRGGLARGVERPAERRQPVTDGQEGQGGLEHGEHLLHRRQQGGVLVPRASLAQKLCELQEALMVPVEKQAQQLQAACGAVLLGELFRQEVVPLLAQGVPQDRGQVQVDQRVEQRLASTILLHGVLLLPDRHGLAL
mmetsp:Transcript_126185/g.365200  ORF Transcript_126185/g.365200 Transcript_126185/m.365200 type:complete len:346 (-) Transcript_126185:2185-3222(-)